MTEPITSDTSAEAAALAYAAQGLYVFPIFEIRDDGSCACDGKRRDCKPGKHPRLSKGSDSASIHPEAIRGWWRMWPTAGIAVNLEKSGLVDVAPDRPERLAEFERNGLPTPARFQSPGGDGHVHHLFRRPVGCVIHRLCRSGDYDILSNGYAILPPTTGKDGQRYTWLTEAPGLNGKLPDAPAWVITALAEAKAKRQEPASDGDAVEETEDEPPIPLSDDDLRIWQGFDAIVTPDGVIDRSASLFNIGRVLWKAGMTKAGVVAAVRERDAALGWDKYRDRTDADIRYGEIGTRLEAEGREAIPVIGLVRTSVTPFPPRKSFPDPLAPAALYGLSGRLLELAAPCSEADPAAILLSFLVMVGNAVGRSPHLSFGTEIHRCNLFVALAGASGTGRKGTSLGPGRAVVGGADPPWAATRIANGLVSGEGVIYHVRDAQSAESGGTASAGLTVTTPKQRDAGVTDKRLTAVESELGSLLAAMHRQGSTLSHVLRSAWDGGVLQSLSKNAPVRATGAHVSVIGHTTEEELRTALTSVDAANGFANRFLWAKVQRSKVLPRPPAFAGPAVDALIADVADVLDHGGAVGVMRLDALAGDAYDAYYRGLPEETLGLAGVMAVRAPAFVLRLAMIYALLDMTSVIRLQHFEAAVAVVRFCMESARCIFGDLTGNPVADRIFEALEAGPLARRRISVEVFSKNMPAPMIAGALKTLEQTGLAYATRSSTGGRPAEVWSRW